MPLVRPSGSTALGRLRERYPQEDDAERWMHATFPSRQGTPFAASFAMSLQSFESIGDFDTACSRTLLGCANG
ncbi:hypothetical protein CBM2585_A130106 [Cupriavidus taiwanensis]|nr:hypothetical protein CBM2585_A130106 [Cupriavidus taiwanensis]